MKSYLGQMLDELKRYSWMFLLVGSCVGSFAAWRVDTAKIKFTQEAQASIVQKHGVIIDEHDTQLRRLDRAVIIVETDIPRIKSDVSEMKRYLSEREY